MAPAPAYCRRLHLRNLPSCISLPWKPVVVVVVLLLLVLLVLLPLVTVLLLFRTHC